MTTVFIISAPSGSGKSTLVARLLSRVPGLMFSVSYTTRKPRGAEMDGAKLPLRVARGIRAMLARDEFLEWAEVFGNYYGTHRGILEQARARGKRPGTRHRRARCETIEEQIPEAVTVFILAPSRQILEQRLRARGEDRDEVIERRLRDAAEEIRKLQRVRLCVDQSRVGRVGRHSERYRARRAGAADQDRRADPAHSGHISSLKRYRRHG